MTKYKDLDIKTVKACCKAHCRKVKGVIIPNCAECPLERPKKFCAFMLLSIHENYKEYPLVNEEYNQLMNEDITKEKEWQEWVERFKSEE